jgi:hypothetical protein
MTEAHATIKPNKYGYYLDIPNLLRLVPEEGFEPPTKGL